MKNVRASSFLQVAGLLVIVVIITSWQPKRKPAQSSNQYTTGQDTTIPESAGIDQIDLQLNLDSVMQQVNLALSKIDYAKINAEAQQAIAQIDYNKINKEINSAMKNIDWNQMKADVSGALDSAKMAVDKINWDQMKDEVSKAQIEAKKQMDLQKINMDSMQRQVQKSLQDAQKSWQSAKIEFTFSKALKTALEKDGLIQSGKPYNIQLKDGILYINGVKQSKTITDKYNRFYQNKKDFSFSTNGGVDL